MGSWKNYARMMGLYGNATQIYRNREPVQAYNGYLDLMYHYGIFAVIPFVLYQIYGFCISLKKCRRFFGKKNPYDMGKTHIIRIFFLESDSGNHDLISQNPLIHILIFLNIQNL